MKKALSILAAIVMGCTAAPMTVFAEDSLYTDYMLGDVDLVTLTVTWMRQTHMLYAF